MTPLTPADGPLLRDAQGFLARWPETGTDYTVCVALPASYRRLPERRYRVLAVLDGDLLFASAAQAARLLAADLTAPPAAEVIVAGIGWADADGAPAFGRLRFRDFSPPGALLPPMAAEALGADFPTGGAPAFLRFLERAAFPWLRAAYRCDEGPGLLFGYSYGGCFALHALLSDCGLFSDYVVGSPGIASAADPLFGAARAWTGPAAPARALFTVGGVEADGPNAAYREIAAHGRAMARLLGGRDGLSVRSLTLPDESHNSGPVRSLVAGLTAFLRP